MQAGDRGVGRIVAGRRHALAREADGWVLHRLGARAACHILTTDERAGGMGDALVVVHGDLQ